MDGDTATIEPSYPKVLLNNPPKTLAELFSRPSRWNKGHNARDQHQIDVQPNSAQAVDWCLHGAICLVYGQEKSNEIAKRLLVYIQNNYPEWKERDALTEWNDSDEIRFKDIVRVCKGAGV